MISGLPAEEDKMKPPTELSNSPFTTQTNYLCKRTYQANQEICILKA